MTFRLCINSYIVDRNIETQDPLRSQICSDEYRNDFDVDGGVCFVSTGVRAMIVMIFSKTISEKMQRTSRERR